MMDSLQEIVSNLYTSAVISLSLFLLEAILVIRSLITGKLGVRSDKRSRGEREYVSLVEERCPAKCYQRTGSLPELMIECVVCLSKVEEGEEIRELQCGHAFHRDCVDQWLQVHEWATCPLCRRCVLPEEMMIEHRRSEAEGELGEGEGENYGEGELEFYFSALHGTTSLHRLF